MDELPLEINQCIRRYKPLEADGLTLYPVLVREYEDFLLARPALEVMHQSLPVAMMRIPLLSALYQMDFEAISAGKPMVGLFSRAILGLALSLRLGEGQSREERKRRVQIVVDPQNPAKLTCLRFTDDNGEEHDITPVQYAKIRKIIAAQNGVKLESDDANPDIVKAKKDMANAKAVELNVNIDDLIFGVSSLMRVDETEIDEWPILKLDKSAKAYERVINYIVCGISEGSGATYKGGNPYPHPFFERVSSGGGLFSQLGETNKSGGVTPPERVINAAAQTIQFP